MPAFNRQQLLTKFRQMIARREPIIGGARGPGCRPSAKRLAVSI